LVQQRLLQRLQFGEFARVEAGEALPFGIQHVYLSGDFFLLDQRREPEA
jgi:hypothetical protein